MSEDISADASADALATIICRGRLDFILGGLVDFLKPKCFRSNVSFSIFRKICRPKCGWGFFFIFFGGFLVFLG